MLRFILLFFWFSFSSALLSQTKYEQEKRISEEEVILPAVKLVRKWLPNQKIKWYLETGLKETTFEAKTKVAKSLYSIEFSDNGDFQDVEVLIPFKNLSPAKQTSILSALESEFDKIKKIHRIQEQYTGESEKVFDCLLKNCPDWSGVEKRYEIVFTGKKAQQTDRFEFTMTQYGMIIKRAKIIPKNSDHLIF